MHFNIRGHPNAFPGLAVALCYGLPHPSHWSHDQTSRHDFRTFSVWVVPREASNYLLTPDYWGVFLLFDDVDDLVPQNLRPDEHWLLAQIVSERFVCRHSLCTDIFFISNYYLFWVHIIQTIWLPSVASLFTKIWQSNWGQLNPSCKYISIVTHGAEIV